MLPFKNLNNDPASSFYEFALADAVITELARIRSLVVRPSSVMSKYQGQPVDPADVGRELNVDAVLSAGFIHIGERFRVTAQLLDVRSSEIIWSDKVDASADDVIAVQDEITQRIVDGLRLELSPDEQAGLRKPRPSTPKPTTNFCADAIALRASSFAPWPRRIAMPRFSTSRARRSWTRSLVWRMTDSARLT